MKRSLLLALIICIAFTKAQVNTFSFNVNGTPPAGLVSALTIAGQKWSNYLNIPVPIKVNVFTVNSNLLPFSAITIANGRRNFLNAPVQNTLYTTALANQIAGAETNPGEYDMDIYFNLYTNFYFGTGKPAANQHDFVSTAMHEIGHGLGFYSDGYVDNNGIGSFGNIPPSAVFPLTPSFPWHGQDSVPGIFDKYIVKASNNSLCTIAPAYTAVLGDSIKNGAVYFSGPLYANPSHSNAPVRLSGGTGSYTLGVDLLHIHNTYANTIMSYYWGAGDTMRIPAPWELGILKEIGWNMISTGINENTNFGIATVYPNPVNTNVFVNAKKISEIKVFNLQGEQMQIRHVSMNAEEYSVDTQQMEEGIYFLSISFAGSDRTVTRKIIVKR